jgi:hypothetical protein
VRARSHPRTVVALWGWQTTLALGASWPTASLVRAFYGASPRGDGELWEPGGHALLDLLRHGARALAPAAGAAEFVLIVGAVAGLLPMAASMFAMAHGRAARFVRSTSRAMQALPALLLLLVIVGAAQAASLGVAFLVFKGIDMCFETSLGDAYAQRLGVASAMIFVLVASGLGVVHDLARAVVVQTRARALRALAGGARAFASAPLSLWWSWAWRALAALAPVAAIAAVATRIGGRGGALLVLLAALHQGVVLSRVALRLSWLARALRAVGEERVHGL